MLKRLALFLRTGRFCLFLAASYLIVSCGSAPPVTVSPARRAAPTAPPVSTRIVSTALPSVPTGAPASPTPVPALPLPAPQTPVPVPLPIPSSVSALPSPSPGAAAARPADPVLVRSTTVTLNVYPYADFLVERTDPATHIPFLAFDRAAYDGAPRTPRPQTFDAIVLENEYLALTFLPALGGRLYQITYKPTSQTLLYNNPVLKPTPWGMPAQGGWLAAGGVEWAFPTQEHGYEWNAAWLAQTASDAHGATITLADSRAADRPHVQVRVTLPAHAAYFTVQPRIENPTAAPIDVQFWINAQLNLAAGHRLSSATRFFLPSDSVFVHSTADSFIPDAFVPSITASAPLAPVSFSNLAGRDLRYYSNWDSYLGVFATAPGVGVAAAYNPGASIGLARIFPPDAAPGVKLFAWGQNFCCRNLYTDDGSEYFELWGGLNRTFFPADDVSLAPGAVRTWTESWMPLPHTGGLTAASSDAALVVQSGPDVTTLTAYSAIARPAVLILSAGTAAAQRWPLTLQPGQVWQTEIPASTASLPLELQTPAGELLVAATAAGELP